MTQLVRADIDYQRRFAPLGLLERGSPLAFSSSPGYGAPDGWRDAAASPSFEHASPLLSA